MSEEESVDLTPGVVWTDAQLAVVRDLTARAFKAEAAVERVRSLVHECWPDDDRPHPALGPHTFRTRFHAALGGPT